MIFILKGFWTMVFIFIVISTTFQLLCLTESEQETPVDSIKGHRLKFRVDSRVRQTPKEGQRTYQPKHCGYNNKDEDNSPKTLNDKNSQCYYYYY